MPRLFGGLSISASKVLRMRDEILGTGMQMWWPALSSCYNARGCLHPLRYTTVIYRKLEGEKGKDLLLSITPTEQYAIGVPLGAKVTPQRQLACRQVPARGHLPVNAAGFECACSHPNWDRAGTVAFLYGLGKRISEMVPGNSHHGPLR
jgi:hypothetical protein